MYICLCKGITDKQVRQAIQNGAKCVRDLHDSLGIATQCGKCGKLAKDLIKEKHKNA